MATAVVAVGGRAEGESGAGHDHPRLDLEKVLFPKVVIYRLRTRGTKACRACRLHHRYMLCLTHQIADTTRAHPGCNCPVVPQAISKKSFRRLFRHSANGVVFLPRRKRTEMRA